MQTIDIPNYKKLQIENIVFDYNGTLAEGGRINDTTKELLRRVCQLYNIYVITADTFGTVANELAGFDLELVVLKSSDHAAEKRTLIEKIGKEHTVAIGNGNNDLQMLKAAELSIAIISKEGCALPTLLAADIAMNDISEVMKLFIDTKRLIATLRK